MEDLPPAQDPSGPYRIAMVCLGNICRSPMAQVVLTERLDDAGLSDRVVVDSCGVGGWHAGDPMDDRAATTLRARDYDPSLHRARMLTPEWFDDHDLLLTMDHDNYRDARDLAPHREPADRVRMYRRFDPEGGDGDDEVPDPWYGGPDGFERVLATIERTSEALVGRLRQTG